MSLAPGLIDVQVHDALAMRSAGADLLQLALMDARNRTLGWLSAFDDLQFSSSFDGFDPPWWLAGQAAWFQEFWVARHVQRGRGELADPTGLRLASVHPRADAWFDPQASTRTQRWQRRTPDARVLRQYLADTLDTTLELLDKAESDDAALHVYRLALYHEDRLGEALAVLVQALDLAPERQQALIERGLWPTLPGRGRREAMVLGGQRWMLGSPRGGFVPEAERWAHEVAVAEFEIDAQPVCWAQFAEFVEDGGYDERRWWTEAGWEMLDATARRAPRYVEQVSGGVLARRQGRLQRLPGQQAVLHVSAHEAEAWCCWAGRRLPAEAEWELAATQAASRGFAWGEVAEWVAGRARPYPGGSAVPALATAEAPAQRVLRGASAWGSARLRHARARQFVAAGRDDRFVGFRSCAV
ncbi:MAG: SUMF1/EgtB/PvdO family nonheme iron enzyme [Aquabacterium sp.]|nr:SUMF1/EgtB/PvdO family nonheme iron enzyme [Aquabacterium sp.]